MRTRIHYSWYAAFENNKINQKNKHLVSTLLPFSQMCFHYSRDALCCEIGQGFLCTQNEWWSHLSRNQITNFLVINVIQWKCSCSTYWSLCLGTRQWSWSWGSSSTCWNGTCILFPQNTRSYPLNRRGKFLTWCIAGSDVGWISVRLWYLFWNDPPKKF